MAAAWRVRILLHLDGAGRTRRNTRVLAQFDYLILLNGGAAVALVRDLVFRGGVSAFTVSFSAARRHLRLRLSFAAG